MLVNEETDDDATERRETKKAELSATGNGRLELEKRGRALVESRMLARLDEARHFRPFECVSSIAGFNTMNICNMCQRLEK